MVYYLFIRMILAKFPNRFSDRYFTCLSFKVWGHHPLPFEVVPHYKCSKHISKIFNSLIVSKCSLFYSPSISPHLVSFPYRRIFGAYSGFRCSLKRLQKQEWSDASIDRRKISPFSFPLHAHISSAWCAIFVNSGSGGVLHSLQKST